MRNPARKIPVRIAPGFRYHLRTVISGVPVHPTDRDAKRDPRVTPLRDSQVGVCIAACGGTIALHPRGAAG
jgi:hypothetical protein